MKVEPDGRWVRGCRCRSGRAAALAVFSAFVCVFLLANEATPEDGGKQSDEGPLGITIALEEADAVRPNEDLHVYISLRNRTSEVLGVCWSGFPEGFYIWQAYDEHGNPVRLSLSRRQRDYYMGFQAREDLIALPPRAHHTILLRVPADRFPDTGECAVFQLELQYFCPAWAAESWPGEPPPFFSGELTSPRVTVCVDQRPWWRRLLGGECECPRVP